MKDVKNISHTVDVAQILESLSDEEKMQAYAMLQGMVIGKELAEQQKPA